MQFIAVDQAPSSAPTTISVHFYKQVNRQLIKSLTGLEVGEDFKGKFKEKMPLYFDGGQSKHYLLGLGEEGLLNRSFEAFRSLAHHYLDQWSDTVEVDLRGLPKKLVFNACLGISLAEYEIGSLKLGKDTKQMDEQEFTLLVSEGDSEFLNSAISEAKDTATVMCQMMQLVDSPANVKTPSFIAQNSVENFKALDIKCRLFESEDLSKNELYALEAVGQGSFNPPVLLLAEYNLKQSQRPVLGLVGKGVTFDTGGLSLKTSGKMHFMKSDMGGAAAVLGAIELAARQKLDLSIVAIVPLTENSVDANSIRPGDVIKSHAKKTIEVINTDAEGRLILADGLSYIQENYRPEFIVDLATLTGSSVRTLGYEAASLFTNDLALADMLIESGEESNEKLWRMPLWSAYGKDLRSDVADIRNIGAKPVAGAIKAAKFLEYFIDEEASWAHIDMAGVAFGNNEFAKSKSASGYGVRLIFGLMKKLVEHDPSIDES